MSLTDASVRRPVFTIMVTLIVVIFGLASVSRLQIDLLPSIELPTLNVRTQYEGASPVVMERLVTQIIEEVVATVPGVKEMVSESSEGNSSVRVSFAWGTNIDTAAVDVQATLQDEISELPDNIVGPRVTKFDIDSFPVVLMGISSDLDPFKSSSFRDSNELQCDFPTHVHRSFLFYSHCWFLQLFIVLYRHLSMEHGEMISNCKFYLRFEIVDLKTRHTT